MAQNLEFTEEENKQLLILKAQYEMHLNTLEEVSIRGKKDVIERMNMIIQDDIAQMAKIDPDFANDCVKESQEKDKKAQLVDAFVKGDDSDDIISRIQEMNGEDDSINDMIMKSSQEDTKVIYEEIEDNDDPEVDLYALADEIDDKFEEELESMVEDKKDGKKDTIYNDIDPGAQYDVIKLPSKGECYKDKITHVPVAYLTAADENLITSPNLYESGSITNILLKRKVMNKSIDVDNLVAGDVDAIMVFLRGTSYGNMFPIIATDPVTKKRVDTEVDLQTLSYKTFTLKGDENGYFDYTMPLTKAKVKFKFLTKGEEKILEKLNKQENTDVVAFELNEAVEKITRALKEDKVLTDSEKNLIIDAKNKIEKWSKATTNKKSIAYTKTVTNSLEMQIVSVNGEKDRKKIHEFVMNMPAGDSLAFRRYIFDNQPGVDFTVDVERPESMGGGSFKCFLEWDDSVFWNISEL